MNYQDDPGSNLQEKSVRSRGIVVFLTLCAIVTPLVFLSCSGNSQDSELEPVYYFRTTRLPFFIPLSGGYPDGMETDESFLVMGKVRYLIMVVSVPARRLSGLDQGGEQSDFPPVPQTESGVPDFKNLYYPEFLLTTNARSSVKPKLIVSWPRGKSATRPGQFSNPHEWYPSPGESPNKKYYLALMWRMTESQAKGPFTLQMDDEPEIEVSRDYAINNFWEDR